MKPRWSLVCWLLCVAAAIGRGDQPTTLPGMEPLALDHPLDVAMVAGIDRHAISLLAAARDRRRQTWPPHDPATLARRRARLREILGVTDARIPPSGPLEAAIERYGSLNERMTAADSQRYAAPPLRVVRARYEVLDGVTADGLWVEPVGSPLAYVIALPDADWTPEQFVGLETGVPPSAQLPRQLAARGLAVFVPTLISRDCQLSGNPAVRFTNQPHREFIYRMAFPLGRHIMGYEVQKVLAGVDRLLAAAEDAVRLPVGVCGVGEGAILALHAAACDERIAAALVCGAFDRREDIWRQPIYRNLWSQLEQHGDAEVAALVAPRRLVIEACSVPEVPGPPPEQDGRRGAAPGRIVTCAIGDVRAEHARAVEAAVAFHPGVDTSDAIVLVESGGGSDAAGSSAAVDSFCNGLVAAPQAVRAPPPAAPLAGPAGPPIAAARHARQFHELVRFTQRLLDTCHLRRAALWRAFDASTPENAAASADRYRRIVHESFIGRLPASDTPPRPRSRVVMQQSGFTAHEIAFDVLPDVIGGGLLLVPEGIPPGERRPVVVCQHGLEGTPLDTVAPKDTPAWNSYKSFAARLARMGYVVYAPQNPYRGGDVFRTLQRKSNPVGLSLFSYIVAQHDRGLDVLSDLPFVAADRIAFYGLSYGGKTAMRVPAVLPRYAAVICSGDFNDWIRKVATTEHGTSYMFHGEYEIPEWNMGDVANYAELSWLIAPRPFMVERGCRDGCAPDEWVAAEYARTRTHYLQRGIVDRTEIEWFDGPHTINGVGSFRFLERFLPIATMARRPE